MSKWVNHSNRNKVISLITLGDDAAIDWLKENTVNPDESGRGFSSIFGEGPDRSREFVEYVWYRRHSSRVNLALCQYGITNLVLRRLKNNRKYKKILLSNPYALSSKPDEFGQMLEGENLFTEGEISEIWESWPLR